MFSLSMLELIYFSFSIEINVLQGRYIENLQEKHGQVVDWMSGKFDPVAAYAASGAVSHGRYFILSSNLISITTIIFIVYIIILYAGFRPAMVLWTTEVIVGSPHPLSGLVSPSNILHMTKS
jgi:hypothetical protein